MESKHIYVCKNCGKEYHAKTIDRKTFCSRECFFKWKAKQSAIRKRNIEQRIIDTWPKCKSCGKIVNKHTHLYCSHECRQKEEKKRAYEYEKGKHTIKIRTCVVCGKEFATEYGDKRKLYCSKTCNKTEGKHIRRARKTTQTIEVFARKEIYERDNWKCGICGKPLHRTKHVPHPYAPTIDHIVPLVCGGTHERKNVQAAHFLCNSIKRDKASEHGDQMRLF